MSDCPTCTGPNPIPRIRTGEDEWITPTITPDGFYEFDIEGLVEEAESELVLTGGDGVVVTQDPDDDHVATIDLDLVGADGVTVNPDGEGGIVLGFDADPPEAETEWTSPNEPGPLNGVEVTTGGTNGHDVTFAVAVDPASPVVVVDDLVSFDPAVLVLAPNTVGSSQIVDGSVTQTELGPGSVVRTKLGAGAVGPAQLDQALIWLPLVSAWSPYDPEWINVSTGSGAPAGPASSVARYKQVGTVCHVHVELNFKTGGGFASGTAVPRFHLPHLPAADSIHSGSAMFIPFGGKPVAAGVWVNGRDCQILWPATASGFWIDGVPMGADPGGRMVADVTYEVGSVPGTGGLA